MRLPSAPTIRASAFGSRRSATRTGVRFASSSPMATPPNVGSTNTGDLALRMPGRNLTRSRSACSCSERMAAARRSRSSWIRRATFSCSAVMRASSASAFSSRLRVRSASCASCLTRSSSTSTSDWVTSLPPLRSSRLRLRMATCSRSSGSRAATSSSTGAPLLPGVACMSSERPSMARSSATRIRMPVRHAMMSWKENRLSGASSRFLRRPMGHCQSVSLSRERMCSVVNSLMESSSASSRL